MLLSLLLARYAWIFASDLVILVCRRLGFPGEPPLGPRATAVLGWAGVRGVVTLALALSLPADFPGRDFILVTAFAVILGTVLVQGTTLGLLIGWTGLVAPDSDKARMNQSQAEAQLMQVQLQAVQQAAYDESGTLVHPQLLDQFTRKANAYTRYVGQEADLSPRVHAHFDVVLQAIAASRAELIRLHRVGDIDEHTLVELQKNLDLEELNAIAARS